MKPVDKDRMPPLAVHELVHRVQEAFAGVTLGKGIGLKEAQGHDDHADEATCARYREGDEKESWGRIGVHALNECNSSLSFFDPEGMRFHLPAYLVAELQGSYDFDLVFNLTHIDEYKAEQFSLLTRPQRQAVRAALLHLAERSDYEYERPRIQAALDTYWTE